MEIATVTKLLTDVALSHPGKLNQEEALRNIALALLHLAKSIEKIERQTDGNIQSSRH